MTCIIKIYSRKYYQIVFGGIRGINHSCYIWHMLACKGTACHYLMATHHTFVILVKTIQKIKNQHNDIVRSLQKFLQLHTKLMN